MNITKIEPQGIYFSDTTGASRFISFNECNKNWLDYRRRKDLLTKEQVTSLQGKDVTVGQRDMDSKKAYIQLFSKPFVKFEFSLPEKLNEYRYLRDSIFQFGWSIIDWS